MKTTTKEGEKQATKELVHALMDVESNQPKCRNCGEKFKPDIEKIKVEIPETEYVGGSRTSHVEKPDYCSQQCEVAHKL